MANILDPVTNFGLVEVSTGYDASATSIVLASGEGAKLPDPATDGAFNLVYWNTTDYQNPTDDPNREIVRVTARSTDTLTVTRGQEGITATTKNTSGKTYNMSNAFTKHQRDLIETELGKIGRNNFYTDQSAGTSDTYGVLSGSVNGSNTVFTVSEAEYVSGSLMVFLNGQLQTQGTGEDWTETAPGSGTFTFATAPETGDLITAQYMKSETTSGNADTVDGKHASAFAQLSEDNAFTGVNSFEGGTKTGSEVNIAEFQTTDTSPVKLRVRTLTSATASEQGFSLDAYEPSVSDDRPIVLQRYGGRVGIGRAAPATTLDVNGSIRLGDGNADGPQVVLASSGYADWNVDNFSGTLRFYQSGLVRMHIESDGKINMSALPTSSTGLASGDLWNDSGTVKIV
jgi:hypothetical protein